MKLCREIVSVSLCILLFFNLGVFPVNAEGSNEVKLNDGDVFNDYTLKMVEDLPDFSITSITFCGNTYAKLADTTVYPLTDEYHLPWDSNSPNTCGIQYNMNDGSVYIVGNTENPKFGFNQLSSRMFNYSNAAGYVNLTSIAVAPGTTVDTSNVLYFNNFFRRCANYDPYAAPEGETPLFSLLDTSQAWSCENMFGYCTALRTLDISQWDLSDCVNYAGMFEGCTNLVKITFPSGEKGPGADVEGGIVGELIGRQGLESIFEGCRSLWEVDLSGFNIRSRSTVFCRAFYDCSSLTRILVNEDLFPEEGLLENTSQSMFTGCRHLVLYGGNGTGFEYTQQCNNVWGGYCDGYHGSGTYDDKVYGRVDTSYDHYGFLTSAQKALTLTFDAGDYSYIMVEMPEFMGEYIEYPSELGDYHVIWNQGHEFNLPKVIPYSDTEGAFKCWAWAHDGIVEELTPDANGAIRFTLTQDTTLTAIYDPCLSIAPITEIANTADGGVEGTLSFSVIGTLPEGNRMEISVSSENNYCLKFDQETDYEVASLPYQLKSVGDDSYPVTLNTNDPIAFLTNDSPNFSCTAQVLIDQNIVLYPGTYTDTLTFFFSIEEPDENQ